MGKTTLLGMKVNCHTLCKELTETITLKPFQGLAEAESLSHR